MIDEIRIFDLILLCSTTENVHFNSFKLYALIASKSLVTVHIVSSSS